MYKSLVFGDEFLSQGLHLQSMQSITVNIYICMKSSFAKTDSSIYFIFFQKSLFVLLRIPSNINQTAVGLF